MVWCSFLNASQWNSSFHTRKNLCLEDLLQRPCFLGKLGVLKPSEWPTAVYIGYSNIYLFTHGQRVIIGMVWFTLLNASQWTSSFHTQRTMRWGDLLWLPSNLEKLGIIGVLKPTAGFIGYLIIYIFTRGKATHQVKGWSLEWCDLPFSMSHNEPRLFIHKRICVEEIYCGCLVSLESAVSQSPKRSPPPPLWGYAPIPTSFCAKGSQQVNGQ